MAEKKYFWLKLPADFFKDRVIKKLRRIAGGDTYTIIYQKMLLLSLENEGNIFFEEIEETFEDEMSLELDENVEDIQMTILFLLKNELMKKIDNYTYFMTQVPEMIGSETDSARRKRKSRKNKNVTDSQKSVTMSQENENKSQAVTKCPTEKEIEKELDLEKEKDINIDKKNTNDDFLFLEWFESIWLKYPRKEGKNRITRSKTKLKELYKDKDNVEIALENYRNKVAGTEQKFIKAGSTFFNGDYKDYIDYKNNIDEFANSDKKKTKITTVDIETGEFIVKEI
jgi:predicted phage replisome organizer